MKKLLLVSVLVLGFAGVTGAASIGVNLGSNETSLATSNVAGVVAQSNWNNAANASGSLSNINNNSGSSTTTDVSWTVNGGGTWQVSANGTATGDAKLMYGYLDPANDSRTSSVSLSQIPYSVYNVYVYFGSNNTGARGSITNGTITYKFTNGANNPGGDGFQTSDYVRTTATGSTYPTANYAVFEGVTGSSVTVSLNPVDSGDNSWNGIFAVQIVEIISYVAIVPSPANGATFVSLTADLSWIAGISAVSHDVYFGTSQAAVASAERLLGDVNGDGTADIDDLAVMAQQWLDTPVEPSADLDGNGEINMADFSVLSANWLDSAGSVFKGNQTATTFDPGTMSADTTYYWRIDEVNGAEPASPWTGNVWSFTTESLIPGQAGNPSPLNGGTGVTVSMDLSWTAGAGATSHNVYFGTSSPGTYRGNQTSTTYDTGTMTNNKTYYWRIDEINAYGTTTGTIWSFTTTPTGSMNYLNNGAVKIGVDSNKGATIIYFSQSGSSRNVINYADLGREVQQSYYAGPIPFMGGYYNGQPWPWNPVEAGDTNGNRSTVLALANNGATLYTKVIPKQWALNNVDSECTMEKWINLDGNTAHVHCKLVLNRADTTQYADCDQELPAVYATNDLYRIFTYNGSSPFTGGALTQMPTSFPWTYTSITEHWIASVDATDWGLGIFTPSSVWAAMGFYGTPDTTPPGSPTNSSTAYMAPIRREALGYNATYEYDFYLILDSLSNIRNYVYSH